MSLSRRRPGRCEGAAPERHDGRVYVSLLEMLRYAQHDISKLLRELLWLFTPLIGWIFAHMSFVIPVRRLRETETVMAFYHPKPAYPFHVLLVPKKAIASLKEMDTADTTFFTDLYSIVQNLVDEFQLPAYRLIVNGGEYQDFPQLHFHLIADVRMGSRPSLRE